MNQKPIDRTRPHRWPPPKVRLARYLLPLIVIGLAIHLLLPQITSLENSINVVRSMSLWLVGAAVAAQVFSYLGSGYLLKAIVDLGHPRLSITRGALITLAAASIGLVAGGWVGAAAATYRWVEKSEDTSEEAILAGVVPFLINNVLLVFVTILGLAYLLIIHNLSRLQVIGYSFILSLVGIGFGVILIGVRYRPAAERLVLRLTDRMSHLLHFKFDPAALQNTIENIFTGLALLRKNGWVRPVLGAGMNVGFDMLTLYFLFIAAGHPANLGVLMAGYGLAFLLGKIAFMFPGGVGVIESGMAAIYTNLGIPSSISVVVILSYRLFSFWLPGLLGFIVAAYLQRTIVDTHPQKGVAPQ